MKILAIVETQFVARNLREHLEDLGYDDPTIVTNTPDAVEQLRFSGFDLIIFDAEWLKPGISVQDFMEIIRRTESSKDIPIILCSSKRRSEDIRLALQAGANGYLLKPYDQDVLKEHLDKILSGAPK